MTINEIELINFRLHKNTQLSFTKDINFIIGGNGEGKTSILEAIYYLATTKNMLQLSDSDAVNFEADYFKIYGSMATITNYSSIISYDKLTNKKAYFLEGKQITQAADIIGKFPVVTITPSDHYITKGSPADRRKFVDSVISLTSKNYLLTLLDYNKTLKQRSALLNQISLNYSSALLSELDVWSENLVKYGSQLIKYRFEFVENFNNKIKDTYQNILGNSETPSIDYLTYGEINRDKNIEDQFKEKLQKRRNDELKRCTNLVGPHRDDFMFKINDLELKKFGSQGQHKTFQIALKFGQFFYIKELINDNPVFLMDDVFGELDTFRSERISEYLKNIGQSFITATDFSDVSRIAKNFNSAIFNIKQGKFVE